MFFTPNFGFISRKIPVQPVKYRSNMLVIVVLGENLQEGAEGEAASARFRELQCLSCST